MSTKDQQVQEMTNVMAKFIAYMAKKLPDDVEAKIKELAADEKSDYSDLYKAVGSLKEDLRMPVILYYIENFNIREIAQIMDISEGAVQKRLARARGKLRQDLQESEAWT